jgi:hypothetical protein
MKSKLCMFFTLIIFMAPLSAEPRYGEKFCDQQDYYCIKVQPDESWDNLFPTQAIKDLVMRLNRMNTPLKRGMVLAIPKQLERVSIYDISPFPKAIEGDGEKAIYISQKDLAFFRHWSL